MSQFKLTNEERQEILERLYTLVEEKLINEQLSSVFGGASQAAKNAAQQKAAPRPFNPSVRGSFQVDCKSKLVKLDGGSKLTKEGNGLLINLFCDPKYRNQA